jgi:hypothetical protein
MTVLQLQPYSILNGQRFLDDTKIVVKKKDFNGIQYKEGRITFSIINCDFRKLVIENNKEIDFADVSISFTGCIIQEIEIKQILSKNISLHFHSTVVRGNIQDNSIYNVSLNNCVLAGGLFLQNIKSIVVSYTEENIFPRRWANVLKRANIHNLNDFLQWKQSYYFYGCENIKFSSNYKEESIGGLYLREFDNSKEFRLGYKLTSEQKKMLNINVSMKYDAGKEHSKTEFEDIILSSVTLQGSPNGKITFENVGISNWYLHDFRPKEETTFYNVFPPEHLVDTSKVEFHESNLDNTWFDNTNFAGYPLVSFYRTKFNKTVFTACRFPNNSISFERFTSVENIHYPERKRQSYYKDQYEIYLQLKTALSGTGNFYESQKLLAISNDALRKVEDVSSWDKFILWTNRLSNNHGLSIKRPIVLFFTLSIILYILYLRSLGRIFNSNEIDLTLIGYYFSFIDPTHRNDFLVDKSEFTSWPLFIDYTTKVITGYFIYQFIAAFRKYGK